MFGHNTKLQSQNDYKEGYNEGVNDVLIAFANIMHEFRDSSAQYNPLNRVYQTLSKQFDEKDETYEE
jgi:hypothetical protein